MRKTNLFVGGDGFYLTTSAMIRWSLVNRDAQSNREQDKFCKLSVKSLLVLEIFTVNGTLATRSRCSTCKILFKLNYTVNEKSQLAYKTTEERIS